MMFFKTTAFLCFASLAFAAQDEADYWTVDYLTPPDGEVVEVGGMDFLPDGRLVLSTRRGQVWIVENPMAENPKDAKFTLFAEGLWEGLGLKVVDGEIFVVQRTELSRLRDEDGDGVCDAIDTICDDWGVSGNYHEFAFGLPVDEEGNFYVSLNVSFFSPKWWHGKSPVPNRGWVVKISPDGELSPFASGMRSPCGLGLNSEGDLFYTDNQGDWMPVCPIFHVKEGSFYGHPASLDWTDAYQETKTLASDTIPPARERENAACWIPYEWSRSTGNLVMNETSGKFGAFEGQMILGEVTNGLVLRAQLEKVRGEYQGACFIVRQTVGSTCRVAFGEDGTLFAGLTNRGWGGLEPSDGVARVRWTGVEPMEMETVHLLQTGFDITFTKALDADKLPSLDDLKLVDYDYDYWWEYGSPERDHFDIPVTGIALSADGMTLTLQTDELFAGRVVRANLKGIVAADGTALLHEEFAYTINQLPEGPLAAKQVAKLVPPPPTRESDEAGWLRLTWGDAFDVWESSGWELVGAKLDSNNPTQFEVSDGNSALCNTQSDSPSDFVSKMHFDDVEVRMSFMLPEGGSSALYMLERYGVLLSDSPLAREPAPGDCGAILAGESFAGLAPARDGYSSAGNWHDLHVVFRAPQFDETGQKVANAKFERVSIDGVVVQEDVELPGVSFGGATGEEALGALRILGSQGHIAIANVQARPLGDLASKSEWQPLFSGDSKDWAIVGDQEAWETEDGFLVGSGQRSFLFSAKDDYKDFDLHAEIKVNDGGNSGLFFRASKEADRALGYEAQINSSFADAERNGSLTGLSARTVQLVGEDTWFDYRISCQSIDLGTHIRIWINDVLVNDFVDIKGLYSSGHIAIEQHHEGSVIEVRGLKIREN
ncbi:MAG: glucose/arabinose dehydrogenase [Planctomycetota bacterium]